MSLSLQTLYSSQQQQDWSALQHASEEMKGDRSIVMAAVQERSDALMYASQELKDDETIVKATVVSLRREGGIVRNWLTKFGVSERMINKVSL